MRQLHAGTQSKHINIDNNNIRLKYDTPCLLANTVSLTIK